MNKVGLLLAQLHDAETTLAAEYRTVAERQAAEHDIHYMGHPRYTLTVDMKTCCPATDSRRSATASVSRGT